MSKPPDNVQRWFTNSAIDKLGGGLFSFDSRTEQLFKYLCHPEDWGNICFIWYESKVRFRVEKNGTRSTRSAVSLAFQAKYPDINLQGKTIRQTCKTYDCINPNHLEAIVLPRKSCLTPQQKERIILLFSQGKSKSELADLFGCKVGYIEQLIRKSEAQF